MSSIGLLGQIIPASDAKSEPRCAVMEELSQQLLLFLLALTQVPLADHKYLWHQPSLMGKLNHSLEQLPATKAATIDRRSWQQRGNSGFWYQNILRKQKALRKSPEQGLWKKFWEMEKNISIFPAIFQEERRTTDRRLRAMKHLCSQSRCRTTSHWKHKRNNEQTLAWSHTWKTTAWGFRLRVRNHTCVHNMCLGIQI